MFLKHPALTANNVWWRKKREKKKKKQIVLYIYNMPTCYILQKRNWNKFYILYFHRSNLITFPVYININILDVCLWIHHTLKVKRQKKWFTERKKKKLLGLVSPYLNDVLYSLRIENIFFFCRSEKRLLPYNIFMSRRFMLRSHKRKPYFFPSEFFMCVCTYNVYPRYYSWMFMCFTSKLRHPGNPTSTCVYCRI